MYIENPCTGYRYNFLSNFHGHCIGTFFSHLLIFYFSFNFNYNTGAFGSKWNCSFEENAVG